MESKLQNSEAKLINRNNKIKEKQNELITKTNEIKLKEDELDSINLQLLTKEDELKIIKDRLISLENSFLDVKKELDFQKSCKSAPETTTRSELNKEIDSLKTKLNLKNAQIKSKNRRMNALKNKFSKKQIKENKSKLNLKILKK